MAANFEEFVASERERLINERTEIFDQQKVLEDKLQGIVRELSAIEAYEIMKAGKPTQSAVPATTKRRGPAPGTQRAPRGAGNTAAAKVLALVTQHGDMGISAKDVAEKLSDVKNTANVLSKLHKDGKIHNDGRGQPYFPGAKSGKSAA